MKRTLTMLVASTILASPALAEGSVRRRQLVQPAAAQ